MVEVRASLDSALVVGVIEVGDRLEVSRECETRWAASGLK
jgi:hypothetical protein